jgi:hypothetical protein
MSQIIDRIDLWSLNSERIPFDRERRIQILSKTTVMGDIRIENDRLGYRYRYPEREDVAI